jgi:predicted transposase YbfD/YdcC
MIKLTKKKKNGTQLPIEEFLCEAIVDLKRDYIVQIKGDQPKIQKAIKSWVKEEVHDAKKKPDATEKKKSNKKDEIITWKLWIEKGNIANHIREELNFPSVMQVAYLEKTILNLSTQEKTIESGYYITSAKQKILPPDNFLLGIRNHWGIENSLHHILDRTMNEDKQRSSTHEQGMNLKILRNLSLNILRKLFPKEDKRSVPLKSIAVQMNFMNIYNFMQEQS